MPLKRCGADGSGWKFGDSGKCYTGPDAKAKAIAQGVAMGEIGKRAQVILKRASEGR